MKWFVMYAMMVYITACADGMAGHSALERVARAICWPATVTSWFVTQPQRLHRFLNILWCCLISGWLLSLLFDRIP